MWILYDLVVVVLFIWYIYRCGHNGFVRTIIDLVGYFVAIFVAGFLSTPCADFLFRKFIEPKAVSTIADAISQSAGSGDLLHTIEQAIANLPSFIAQFFQFDADHLLESGNQFLLQNAEKVASEVVNSSIRPLAMLFMTSILLLIIFSLSVFLIHRLSYLFTFLNKIPLLGTVNTLLGGVVGFFKAIIILFILSTVIYGVLGVTGSMQYLNNDLINQTFLFKIFYELNPLQAIFAG